MMDEEIINMDQKARASKDKLEEWIKHRLPARGDRTLWGKPMGGRGAQAHNVEQREEPGPDDEGGRTEEDQQQLGQEEDQSQPP